MCGTWSRTCRPTRACPPTNDTVDRPARMPRKSSAGGAGKAKGHGSATMTDTSQAHGARTSAPPPGRLFRAALLLSATLTIMAAAVIAPSLPEMSQVYAEVPAADVLVRLALTITSLAIGLSATVMGALTDRIGRKPVLVGSLVLYALAGVSGYAASDLTVLLTTRAVLGVAVGGIMSSVTTMITDLFEGSRRARFLGLQAAAASAGGVVFLPLAGLLAGVSWRAPFWIYAVALLIVPVALMGVRETHVPRPRQDPVGASGGQAAGRTRVAAGRTRVMVPLIFSLAAVGTLVFFMAPTQMPFSCRSSACRRRSSGSPSPGPRSAVPLPASSTPGWPAVRPALRLPC